MECEMGWVSSLVLLAQGVAVAGPSLSFLGGSQGEGVSQYVWLCWDWVPGGKDSMEVCKVMVSSCFGRDP